MDEAGMSAGGLKEPNPSWRSDQVKCSQLIQVHITVYVSSLSEPLSLAFSEANYCQRHWNLTSVNYHFLDLSVSLAPQAW